MEIYYNILFYPWRDIIIFYSIHGDQKKNIFIDCPGDSMDDIEEIGRIGRISIIFYFFSFFDMEDIEDIEDMERLEDIL